MKVLLACLVLAVVVIAEDVFFYDKNTADMVHRVPATCHVMTLTQEQQDNFVAHEPIVQLKELMRSLEADSNNTSPLAAEDVTPFIEHHCHNRELIRVTQP